MEKQKFNQPEFFPRGTVARIEIFNTSFLFVVESVFMSIHNNMILRGFQLDPSEDSIDRKFGTTGQGIFENLASDNKTEAWVKYSFKLFNPDSEKHQDHALVVETLFIKTMAGTPKPISWTTAIRNGYSYGHVVEIVARGKGRQITYSGHFKSEHIGCNLKTTTTEVFSTRVLAIKQFLNIYRAKQYDSCTQSKAMNRCYRQNRNRILDRRVNREKARHYSDYSDSLHLYYDSDDRYLSQEMRGIFEKLTSPIWERPLQPHGWVMVPDFKLPTYEKYGVKMTLIKLSYLHDSDMCRYFYTQEPEHVLSVLSEVTHYLRFEVCYPVALEKEQLLGNFEELLDFICYSNANRGVLPNEELNDDEKSEFEDDPVSHWSQPWLE